MAALSHGCKPRIGLPSCTISSMIITFSPCESLDPLQNSMMVKSTITLGILKLHDLIYSTNPRPKTNFLKQTCSARYSGEMHDWFEWWRIALSANLSVLWRDLLNRIGMSTINLVKDTTEIGKKRSLWGLQLKIYPCCTDPTYLSCRLIWRF